MLPLIRAVRYRQTLPIDDGMRKSYDKSQQSGERERGSMDRLPSSFRYADGVVSAPTF